MLEEEGEEEDEDGDCDEDLEDTDCNDLEAEDETEDDMVLRNCSRLQYYKILDVACGRKWRFPLLVCSRVVFFAENAACFKFAFCRYIVMSACVGGNSL